MDIGELKRQMKEGKSNILVAVRIRPLSNNELIISSHETMGVTDNKVINLNDPQFEMSPNDVAFDDSRYCERTTTEANNTVSISFSTELQARASFSRIRPSFWSMACSRASTPQCSPMEPRVLGRPTR